MVGLVLGAVDADFLARHDTGGAADDVNAVLLEQELDAFVHGGGDTTGTVDHGIEVGFDSVDLDAVVGGMLGVVESLSTLHEGLGGDTAPVEADATEVFTFNNGSFQTHLGTLDGSHIASGTAANNNQIVFHISQFL